MENFATLLIPALLSMVLLRLVLLPVKLVWKAVLHMGCGFLCLWLLNSIALFTGISIPVNAVTALIAGFFGVPGMGLLVVLEML